MIFKKMFIMSIAACTKIGQKKVQHASKKTASLQRAGRNSGHQATGGMGVVFFGSLVRR